MGSQFHLGWDESPELMRQGYTVVGMSAMRLGEDIPRVRNREGRGMAAGLGTKKLKAVYG